MVLKRTSDSQNSERLTQPVCCRSKMARQRSGKSRWRCRGNSAFSLYPKLWKHRRLVERNDALAPAQSIVRAKQQPIVD